VVGKSLLTGFAVLACLAACSRGAAAGNNQGRGPAPLTEDAIAAYASKMRDSRRLRESMEGRKTMLGLHHGTRVVADFPCGDICPTYTNAIVHYDVDPGDACTRAGGVVRVEQVPMGIAVVDEPFCVPRMLVERHIQTDPFKP
jgi:hypothetical protein